MKTKLIISIEVDEQLDETTDLFKMMYTKGECRISDVFDPDQKVILQEMSGINVAPQFRTLKQAVNGDIPKDPDSTTIKLLMLTRK